MDWTIQDEIDRMGPLKSSAQVIVDYVNALSGGSKFMRYTEWTLEPDNWVTVRFAFTRTKTITLTLGVRLSALPSDTGLKMDNRLQWARLQMKRIEELPAVLQCLQIAYYGASNRHRKASGYPKKVR